jgi:GTP-binding protein Era
MKSAFISLVGRPSSGKSTLVNRLCGNKVSIVSTVPQTTRNKIRGIVTRKEGQLVFIDTPGFHRSEKKFNLYMKDLVVTSLEEVDMVLYLIDLTRPVGDEERALMKLLRSFRGQVVVALNKSDQEPSHETEIAQSLSEHGFEQPYQVISALSGSGVEALLSRLYVLAPEGEALYPEEFYTDQEPEFRIAEVIREKAILQTRQEVPHSLFVEIADSESHGDLLWIRAFLHVERESQKGILVGRGGSKIKSIRLEAEQELRQIFPYRVELDLRVKVTPKWRRRDHLLKKLVR